MPLSQRRIHDRHSSPFARRRRGIAARAHVGSRLGRRWPAGIFGCHQLHRPQRSLHGGAGHAEAICFVADAAWVAVSGVLLDVFPVADHRNCRMAGGSLSGRMGHPVGLCSVVAGHDGHGPDRGLRYALPLAAAAGRRRVRCVSLLFADFCDHAPAVPRARQRTDRCGDQAGAGTGRVPRRAAPDPLWMAHAVCSAWCGRADLGPALVEDHAAVGRSGAERRRDSSGIVRGVSSVTGAPGELFSGISAATTSSISCWRGCRSLLFAKIISRCEPCRT